MHRPGGLAAALLGGLLILGAVVPAGTAAATRPPRNAAMPEAPTPGYTPRFVTQTDERPPWEDCLWASTSMLLDKWTHGRTTPDRFKLRRASGDAVGGSRFADFSRAVSRLYGWRARWSPDGGDPMTWNGLLERLAKGGGAVIAGDYGDLGWPYVRWSPSYAAARNASGHAMYIERYDKAHDRLWVMDPLGRAGYRGEWVPTRRVHAFIWHRGPRVYALATPAPPSASTTGWQPGALALDAGTHRPSELVPVSLPFLAHGPWKLPALELSAQWKLVTPDGPAVLAAAEGAIAPPAEAPVAASGDEAAARRYPLDVTLPSAPLDEMATATPLPAALAPRSTLIQLPDTPGLWRLTANVEPVGGGRGWLLAPLDVRLWGDRGAVVQLPAAESVSAAAGQPLTVNLVVENAGGLPWSTMSAGPQLGEEELDPTTELRVSWLAADGRVTPAAASMTLMAAAGQQMGVSLSLVAPHLSGDYVLHVDVIDRQGTLLAPESPADLPLVIAPAPAVNEPEIQPH